MASSVSSGQEPRGPLVPELRQGRDPGHQHGDSGPRGAVRQAHRVPDRVRRRDPRLLGAGVPVQARRDAGSDSPTTPTTSSRSARSMKTGAFVGRCTEMCGTYHSMMNFELRVVEPNDFKAYLQQRIAGKTNAEALIGHQPAADGGHHPSVRHPPRGTGGRTRPGEQVGTSMHIEARLFEFLTAFFVLAAVVYGTLTHTLPVRRHRVGRRDGPGDDRGSDADHRHLLPVRRASTRHQAGGLRGRRDQRRRRRTGLLQPAQLVADHDRAVRLRHGRRRRAVAAVVAGGRRWSSCSPPSRAWSSSTTPAPRSTDRSATQSEVTSGLQLVTYRAAEFDPLIGLGRVAEADSKWLSAACCRADEVVEKDRRK